MTRPPSHTTTEQQTNVEIVLYLIHHVFLPPKLPQEDDVAPGLEDALAVMVLDSLQEFDNLHGHNYDIDAITSMVKDFRTVHDDSGHITQARLEEMLAELSRDESKVIALHVRAQNAGLLVHRSKYGAVFEVFELSPDNKSVVSTKGRLQRSFPAFAVSVPLKNLSDQDFRTTLAQAVSKMSVESVDEMQPKVQKAGEEQSETRDTAIPHLVTEHLASFLRAVGEPVSTTTITKNTREEVLWKDAKLPWRRSSLWLLVRVTMQLTLSRLSEDPQKSLYKPLLVFIMSRILKLALTHPNFESDIIYAMNAKLSQRLLKIEAKEGELWLTNVWDIMKMAHSHISLRWESVMANSCPSVDVSACREFNPPGDVWHELPRLKQFLHQLQSLSTSTTLSEVELRGIFPSFDPDGLPGFAHMALDSLHESFRLTALETWVELHLETWLSHHINAKNTCVALKNLIEAYHREAETAYQGNPEASSIMVLTIMDLWIACDKAACCLYESLKLYDHEIDPTLLWSLLLPLKSQLSHISNVETYLLSRTSGSNKTFVSPFRDFGHQSSFAVRYFDESLQHQQLLTKIEKIAHQQRSHKIQELDRSNQLYQELMVRHDSCTCDYLQVTHYDINGSHFEETEHSDNCKRCEYRQQAGSMEICVHEWPVSKEPNKAKATIFELTMPPDFGAWRDITLHILQTVLGCTQKTSNTPGSDYTLERDPGIKRFYRASSERVGIRSHTKPNSSTHRRSVQIPATQEFVCLANGLSYQYYDFKTGCLIDSLVATNELHTRCVFKLPIRSRPLQKFLQRTPSEPNGPEPNEVIANLSECPDAMSLDEFKSFALLPLGYEIQWQNILSQLAIPSINFAKVDTTFLLLQVSQQIGPNNHSPSRASHEVLSNERFCASLLDRLREAKQRVGENWESFQAIAAFTCLAARLLASTPFPTIQSDCLVYLAACRYLLFGWVTKFRAKVQSSTDDAQRAEFAALTVEIALVCMSTFNIDREGLNSILCSTGDASTFIQCSITIQEHIMSINSSRSPSAGIFLARWRRLMYAAYYKLVRHVVKDLNSCLNVAIKEFWADYKPGSAWQPLPVPKQHWLQSSSGSDGNNRSFSVHFNLLTAELLVNGAPLAKLPAKYESHGLYATLFGRSHIQVMPSSQPGYQFSSRCEYADHLVHFGMLEGDMLLHTVKDDSIYSLVPPRVLSGLLPQAFVKDYVHWFDHQLQAVSFVPIKDPWSRSPHYWRLSDSQSGWKLTRGDKTLVNMQSQTARVIENILSPLEDSLFVHIIYRAGSESIDVELTRNRLDFFINKGDDTVWSRQFQDMFVDRNQNAGTLFGLTSKLVLKSADGSRRVLIPEGSASYQRQSGHVSVSIERGVSRIHSYYVDDQLGRLVGSGSMQSMLLLCYLHGLTSYCLPDPLTKITGTEQALAIITSAAVRSFDILDQGDLNVLDLIARLAPKRLYYPQHSQEMQSVYWNSQLSFMSQHEQLYLEVRDIFSQAMRSKPLHSHVSYPPSLDWTEPHLVERDLIRSSTIRVSGFGAEKHTDKYDNCYRARDRGQRSDRAQRAFVVARSILNKEPSLTDQPLKRLDGHLWGELSEQERIPGPGTKLTQTETLYGGHLLGKTAQYLAGKWCRAHVSLSQGRWENKYQLTMWLSTTAFALNADMMLIGTIIAFYCIPSIAQVVPPDCKVFSINKGDQVRNLAGSIEFHPLDVCPEARLPPFAREKVSNTRVRRNREFEKKKKVAETSFIHMLESQWPREHPNRPSGDEIDVYIKVESSMASIRARWRVWWDNLRFHDYLDDVENELSKQSYQALDTNLEDFTHTRSMIAFGNTTSRIKTSLICRPQRSLAAS